jgi:peptidoglycan hydrolase-like protein with peptidoglycan-binding domain
MTFSLIWMPDVLRSAKLRVALVDGWEDRGRGEVGKTLGVICHHTAGRPEGNMPALRTLIDGRPDLPGPLAQLGLGRDGTFYVIAAGRANHAGKGSWNGVNNGNMHFIGIEAENTGRADDQPWPAVQVDAYQRGVAALLGHVGLSADACAGHKEYALPRGRKIDPSLDMAAFRAAVSKLQKEGAPAPVTIPAVEPSASPGRTARETLMRPASGALVSELQRRIRVQISGKFDGMTEAAVRKFQREHKLVPDGIVGPRTWAALDQVA